MKTRNKVLLLALCALLLVATTVFATLAYLESVTDEVVNTFTVGNVSITMDEAPVDANGQAISGARVKANTYKLISGKEYDKDPTIHVANTSEDAYLFVRIDNNIASVLDGFALNTGWNPVAGQAGLYVYGTEAAPTMVDADDTNGTDVVVFDGFTVLGAATNEQLANLDGETITLKAFAIQADEITPAAAVAQAKATLFPAP